MSYTKTYVDGMLLGYGDKLFAEPVSRTAPKKPKLFNILDPISNNSKKSGWGKSSASNKDSLLRDQINRTVNKDPEVMLKITSKKEAGKGMNPISNHLDYISRNGKVELETDQGEIITTKSGVKELQAEWKQGITGKAIPEKSEKREALNFMLSMPQGTPPDGVLKAGRAFLAETFGGKHAYVFALHTDTDKPHIHACVQVAPLGKGKRLNPRKADLSRWREQFAEQLRHVGIAANATPRRTRGISEPSISQAVLHLKERQGLLAKSGVSKNPVETVMPTHFNKSAISKLFSGTRIPPNFTQEIMAWSGMAKLLARSPSIEDRALSRAVSLFSIESYAIKPAEITKAAPDLTPQSPPRK